MPRTDSPRMTCKEPPTFGQRYGFLIAGAFIVLVLAGGLALGWMAFHEQRLSRALNRSAGLSDGTTQNLNGTDQLHAEANGRVRLSQIGRTGEKTASPAEPNAAGGSPWEVIPLAEAEQRAAQQMLASFWNTPSWRDKSTYVRDAGRVTPLMQDFYEVRHRQDPRAGAFVSAAAYRAAPFEILHLVYESASDRRPLEFALVKDADGSFKLDWESYAGVGDMPWEVFQQQRPVSPVLLRAYAVLDDYYNFEFSDASRFLCLKLVSSDFERVLYAFAETSSETAQRLTCDPAARSLQPLTIRVAYPENARSTNCVRLVDVVANRWLLLDEAP